MSKKKKILLLSDDLRMHSGIATVSKDIVMETLNEYDWVQMGGAIKHPEKGKVFDLSNSLKDFGVDMDEPDLFSSENKDHQSEELLRSSETDEEDDLEIPAFLRRQKN